MYKRFAEFILGLLENTFATMTNKGIFMRGDIVIDLQEKNTGNFNAIYTFNGIETYTIEIDTGSGYCHLTKEGYYIKSDDAECIIFPSKEQRDWSNFSAPWYKKDKFDPKTLQPFDRVLVRDYIGDSWACNIFSHIQDNSFPYSCILDSNWHYCIPYNEDTKHLVGTANEAPEYYRYWGD